MMTRLLCHVLIIDVFAVLSLVTEPVLRQM